MDKKPCTRCNEIKPLEEFHNDKRGRFGKSFYCKECNKKKVSTWRKSQDRNGKGSHLRYKFKITLESYDEMLELQGGVCAICGGVNANGRALAVDHDHSCCPGKFSCGKCVRGLLCTSCNQGIGHLGDDVARLGVAIDYITKWRN